MEQKFPIKYKQWQYTIKVEGKYKLLHKVLICKTPIYYFFVFWGKELIFLMKDISLQLIP